jgi:hypothetical protein
MDVQTRLAETPILPWPLEVMHVEGEICGNCPYAAPFRDEIPKEACSSVVPTLQHPHVGACNPLEIVIVSLSVVLEDSLGIGMDFRPMLVGPLRFSQALVANVFQ